MTDNTTPSPNPERELLARLIQRSQGAATNSSTPPNISAKAGANSNASPAKSSLPQWAANAACPHCYDRGFLGHLDKPCNCAAGQRHALQLVQRKMRGLIESGLAESLVDKTFDTFDDTGNVKVKAACLQRANGELADDQKPGIVLQGPTGIGKTHLLAAMAHTYFARNIPVIFEIWAFLYRRMQKGLDDGTYAEILHTLTNAPIVMLDDVGAEYVKNAMDGGLEHNWVSSILYEIIDTRCRQRLPLIISTNLPIEQFASRYGERVLSRIIDLCAWAVVKGSDRRIASAQFIED